MLSSIKGLELGGRQRLLDRREQRRLAAPVLAEQEVDAGAEVDIFGNLTTIGDITTSDLTLSNAHRSEGNEVDGTTGHWCFQEGETDLFLINRISGKKYAIELREVG